MRDQLDTPHAHFPIPFRVRTTLGALSAVASLGITPLAVAQSGASALEEVIVTATRREESVQDVAMSITAISELELQKRGVTSFEEIQGITSSIYLDQATNMTAAEIYVRGVGTSGLTSTDPSVGVVVDGVYQRRLGTAFTEMYDVARVEVMRGPQGTLFGKNTTAGLVSVSTVEPQLDEFSAKMQGVVGNLDALELRGVANIPLIDNALALRVSGYTAERDGYTDNVFIPEETRNLDRQGFRGKLLWSPTDNLEFLFSAETSHQENNMDQAVVAYAPGTSPDLPPVSLGRAQQQHSETEDEYDRYIMDINWQLGDHSLRSVSAWEEIETFLIQDRDGTAVNAQLLYSNPQTDVFTQEIQISSNFDGAWNYIAGLFYQEEDLVSPTQFAVGGGDPFLVNLTERVQESQAVFGNVTYEFSDSFNLTVGARYTDDEKVGPSDGVEYTRNFEEWTYSLKARYHLDADKMFYAAFDHGFKSGGINRATEDGLFPTFWEPEFADNYEVGIKSSWLDNRLRLNGALFYTLFEDFQVTQTLPDLAVVAITNAGEVSSTGIEADLAYSVTEGLTFTGSLAFIQTEYEEYAGAPCNRFQPQPGCGVDGTIDLSGETKDHSPEWSGNLGAEYLASLTDGMDWFVRGTVNFRGEMNLDPTLDPQNEEDAHTFLAARAGVMATDGQWQVTLWGKNLTDEEYVTVSQFNSSGHLQKFEGLTRTYGVTLDWNF